MRVNGQSSRALFRKMWRNSERVRADRQSAQGNFLPISRQRHRIAWRADITLPLGLVDLAYHTIKAIEQQMPQHVANHDIFCSNR